ncbi:MAG: 2-C-methyl-D-erythritol 2,4-cyclodiphosphate synthase [Fibrobacter sp.]|nr:2-C-methyl-D-erythritol 2,4-cyclodiphosphate synthase [Fibrobacter sp.]
MYISSIGQDSHRFESQDSSKPLILGGVIIPQCVGLKGNSDADVVLHAITNAISGLSGINILGKVSDDICLKHGITDSRVYLAEALKTVSDYRILHVSVTVEALRPHLADYIPAIRESIAQLLSLETAHVGLTATTGESLTGFGRGEGIGVFAIISAQKNVSNCKSIL